MRTAACRISTSTDRATRRHTQDEEGASTASSTIVVVLGIGGSLGLISLHSALNHPLHNMLPDEKRPAPRLFVFDNIDPDDFAAHIEILDLNRTVFFVISKSGSTAETMSQYLVVKGLLREKNLDASKHIIAITDPEEGILHDIAAKENMRTFPVPPGVGGRFSVLTPVGLAPAALVGIDIEGLLEGAGEYTEFALSEPVMRNPSLFMACALFLLYHKGYTNHVMMPYSNLLLNVADWYRQLWAESLGKKHDRRGRVVEVGPTPIRALGATDQHSQVQLYAQGPRDKAFIFVGIDDHDKKVVIPQAEEVDKELGYLSGHNLNDLLAAELEGTIVALTDSGRPNCRVNLPEISPRTVSQLFLFWEMTVSFIGELFDINAYDQPGVEAGKKAAYALMGRKGFEKEAKRIKGLIQEVDSLTMP
ncbi:MAG: glucose-6-phosphate isomerase [Planctomycetota bacterium]|nr:glucose-6-phosphate isomerase [Planctomycetota bacterium]